MIEKIKYYLLIILPIIIVYGSNINNDLVYCDDHEIILVHKDRIDNLNDIKSEFFKGYIETYYYRPLINISFVIDKAIGGDSVKVYQISNILYHIIATLLFFNLLLLFKIAKNWALLFSIIFSLLPINVNAVSWIVGRNDIIYTIFSLSSLIFLLKSKKNIFLLISAFFSLLAFLSKETALLTPIINLVIAYFYLKFNKKELSIYSTFIGIAYIVYFLLKNISELGDNINKFGIDILIKNLPVIPEFLSKIFVPIDMMPLATYGTLNTSIGLGILLISIVSIIKFELYKNMLFIIGIFIFLLITSPAMLVTVSNSNDWNEYLECRAYLPVIGILISLASIFSQVKLKKIHIYIVVILSVVYSYLSIKESTYYSDRFTFYNRLIEKDNSKALFPFMLSRHYRSVGDIVNEEVNLIKAAEANKTYYKYPMNLGIFYFKQNYFTKSFENFEKALAIDSTNLEVISNYTNALLKTNKFKETYEIIENYTEHSDSLSPDLKINYLTTLIKLEKVEEAINFIDDDMLNEYGQDIFSLLFFAGEDYFNEGKYPTSESLLLKAVEINRNYIEPYIVLLKLYIATDKRSNAEEVAKLIVAKGGKLPDSIQDYLGR